MAHYPIFLSHIHEDQLLAGVFKDLVERAFVRAVRVFVSTHEDDLRAGDDWFEEIRKRLIAAETVVLLLTPLSLSRPWVNFEGGAAWFLGKHVIPVCAHGLDVSKLPPPFNRVQAIDLRKQTDIRRLLKEIAKRADLDVPDPNLDPLVVAAGTAPHSNGSIDDNPVGNTRLDARLAAEDPMQNSGEDELPEFLNSDEQFEWRLSDAFPGLRGVESIDNCDDAVGRLEVLLRPALYQWQQDERGTRSRYHPFWWFRGPSNSSIERAEVMSDGRFLIGFNELRVKRIVAVRAFSRPDRDFVYLETHADDPVGCYQYEQDGVKNALKNLFDQGEPHRYFVSEECGLWNGQAVSLGEFLDGSTLVDGRPVRLTGAERRVRFLTPYNMIICGKRHVINQTRADYQVLRILDGILYGDRTVDDLVELVANLPQPEYYHDTEIW